jgi:hypothetical protein
MIHRSVTSALIARPIDETFDWITTLDNWPRFSPATLGIDAEEPSRPVRVGDRFRERVRILSWIGHFDWQVEVVERPYRCVLSATSAGDTLLSKLSGHQTARIEYTMSGDERSTRFTRELTLTENIVSVVGDLAGFGEALDRASAIALETMVSMLENPLLHGPQVDSAAESLLHESDPLGDEAVASLIPASGDTGALVLFLDGLYRGAPPLDDVPPPMRRFFEATASRPAWTCNAQMQAASKVFLEWGVLSAGAHICASLPETYVMPRVARLLNLTRQLDSRRQTRVDRRLMFTVRLAVDVLSEPLSGEGLLALQRLRLIHSMVRMFVQRRLDTPHRLSALSSDALWDTADGQPISQLELLHTLLTFSHVILRSFDIWQCRLTPYQRESYIHIWNVAAVTLGIRPDILPRNAADAARIFETIKQRYGAPTPEAVQLGQALIGFWVSVLPEVTHNEALQLLQATTSTLLSPETVRINGLEQLPAFSPVAMLRIKEFLKLGDHFLAGAYSDLPSTGQAAALFMSLLMRTVTHSYQDQSGIGTIPDTLWQDWMRAEG